MSEVQGFHLVSPEPGVVRYHDAVERGSAAGGYGHHLVEFLLVSLRVGVLGDDLESLLVAELLAVVCLALAVVLGVWAD